jgi:spermidine synthase
MVQIEILEHKGHRFMYLDGYLWMWDTPQEKEMQKELAEQAFGDVLVAGYGFGLLLEYLLQNQKVESITVIEKHKEVVDKMKEIAGQIYGKVIIDDFYNIDENKKYDCVIGDIWPDINAKFLNDYLKFKEKASKLLKKDGIILAWGRDFFEYLIEKALN